MARMPRLTARKVLRVLRREGWREQHVRSGTGHVYLIHPTKPGKVTVPVHPGETLDPKVLKSILHQAGLTVEELRRVL